MNKRVRAAALRAGAAFLLAAGTVAVAGPAYAADGPDVVVTPISLSIAKGVKEAKAKPFKVELLNLGNADATDVVVELDFSGLKKKIGYVVPDGCEATGDTGYRCEVGDIAAGQDLVIGVPLFNANGKRGAGGFFTVNAKVDGDTEPESNTVDVDVTVVPETNDLTVWAQDVYAEVVADGDDADEGATKTPVPAGGTAPLDSAVFNHGSKRVVGVAYLVELPEGASIASAPEDCYTIEYLNGVACEDEDVVLEPGEVLLPKVTVKVAEDAPEGVLFGGLVFAMALNPGAGDREDSGDQARIATKKQKEDYGEADEIDNLAFFDVFVGPAPSGEPTPQPTTPPAPGTGGGDGDGGGLPVTGAQSGVIAGVGLAVVAAGAVLFVAMRRRRRFVAE